MNFSNHILNLLQQTGFVEEYWCLTGLPAVQTFYQLKTFGVSCNTKYKPSTVEQLKFGRQK